MVIEDLRVFCVFEVKENGRNELSWTSSFSDGNEGASHVDSGDLSFGGEDDVGLAAVEELEGVGDWHEEGVGGMMVAVDD